MRPAVPGKRSKPLKRGRSDAPAESTVLAGDTAGSAAAAAEAKTDSEEVVVKPIEAQRRDYVKAIEQRSKENVDSELLAQDPVYRIMRQMNRSDMFEIVKCKFGDAECVRAAKYGKDYFSTLPLRHVRLQLGIALKDGLFRLLPLVHSHRFNLRLVDLSRNVLNEHDIGPLCAALGIDNSGEETSVSAASQLEVLDLSCNRNIGDRGVVELFEKIKRNRRLRAVILKFVGLTDDGAVRLSNYLRVRPEPLPIAASANAAEPLPSFARLDNANTMSQLEKINFFVNLNENCIGAVGLVTLGKGLPDYVSLTAVKQRLPAQKATS